MRARSFIAMVGTMALATSVASAGVEILGVVSHSPSRNALAIPVSTTIDVVFDRAVNAASFTADPFRFHAFGERSGVIEGSFTFLDGETRARFTPSGPLTPGERVWVTMSSGLAGADASNFRGAGYTWQFWVAARPAELAFTQIDILDTTTPGVSPRPYGGQACDMNNDGAVDICIVNEDSSDLRVFLNNPGSPGQFADFIQPTASTGPVPSPNEAADFNGDGIVDLCTANTSGNTVSVLLGIGNGRFQPAVDYVCGSGPHGIAVLDIDGDGDMDIATANTNASNVGVLRNNGSGVFSGLTQFEGGGSGEWGLNAADMNNDGIADLIVGSRFSGVLRVFLGNGNGTFTPGTQLNNGIGYWMIVCADLNGDGHLDVTSAASESAGVVHMGNGAGGLGPAQQYGDGGMIATDVGDLDGDGDLDWVLSNFGAGQWYILENNGAGGLSLVQLFPATSNPACALILDFDLDGALDLAMIDEISDEVFLLRNTPTILACPGDANGDRMVDFGDFASVLANFGNVYSPGTGAGDADSSGTVDFGDVAEVLANFGTSCS